MSNRSPHTFLQKLSAKRQEWVKSSRENGFEEGIQNLLTQLYPDKAHFIYELLQNAEDAQATHVHFDLQDDQLIVEHNGKRPFKEEDVDSITSIGQSTKKDDINQIGKFGVGFKAVFAYTTTPQVHSQDYAFEIRDLVCPYPLNNHASPSTKTRFVFPFNHPVKSAATSFQETRDGLNELAHNTLLFLNSISKISWKIQNEKEQTLTRVVEQGNLMRITSPGNSSYWLRFTKPLEDGSSLYVAIAFELDFQDNVPQLLIQTKQIGRRMKIVPIEGKLHIFFPAEREVTGLKFHIHGPYASTVARDSIPYMPDNACLLEKTALLVAESLSEIKEAGLLTPNFLGVLPNDKDKLNEFYQPIRESIISRMKTTPLVPTHAKGHAPAQELLQSLNDIRRVISDKEMPFFTGKDDCTWATGVLKDSDADRLLRSLGIPSWEWNELAQSVDARWGYHVNTIERDKNIQWLAQQTDDWMNKWYDLLRQAQNNLSSPVRWHISYYPIIRTQTDDHLKPSDVYFPTDTTGSITDSLPRVKAAVLQGSSKTRNEHVRKFLADIGVREVGEREEIQAILNTYYTQDGEDVTDKQHRSHIKRFIAWWKEEKEATLFQEYYIFRDDTDNYRQPSQCYIDRPFQETGLAVLANIDYFSSYALWNGYKKLDGFIDFARAAGVLFALQLKKDSINIYNDPHGRKWDVSGNRIRGYGINSDWTIHRIDVLLKSKQKGISLLVWKTMSNANPECLTATYRPNRSYSLQTHPSTLVIKLRDNAWIPDRKGVFRYPAEMTREELPSDFIYDDRNGWLAAIGFGSNAIKKTKEYQQKQEFARQLGFSVEIIDEIEKLPPDERSSAENEFLALLKKKNQAPASSPSSNPERRRSKGCTRAQDAAEIERKIAKLTKRLNKIDATPYLILHESNEDDDVICQICGGPMPFKYKPANAEEERDYFEAVQFVRGVTKEHEANHLALCPNCAAEYKYACTTPEEERVRRVLALNSEGDESLLVIRLDMPNHTSLRFTQSHVIDLQAALEDDFQSS